MQQFTAIKGRLALPVATVREFDPKWSSELERAWRTPTPTGTDIDRSGIAPEHAAPATERD